MARTSVLGVLRKPTATDEDSAQAAAECGVTVAPLTPDASVAEKRLLFTA